MANICAARAMLSYIKTEPEGVFTYGSPRVGCKKYVSHVKLPHYRWVNNNDIVTRVPPVFLGYRHSGSEMYIDRLGRLKEIEGWRRVSDRLQGFLSGLRRLKVDQLSDHSVPNYIDAIFKIVRAREANQPAAPAVVATSGTPESSAESEKQLA